MEIYIWVQGFGGIVHSSGSDIDTDNASNSTNITR